jgi:probable rRNA maturation factor
LSLDLADVPPDLHAAVAAALDAAGVTDGHLAVELVDPDRICELNREHRGRNAPTDVLAFPIDGPLPPTGPPVGPSSPGTYGASRAVDDLDVDDEDLDDDEPWLLGDVVLCPSYAAEGAARAGQPLEAELELLVVHGILHLCGLDHADPDEERAMTARTDELLARWRSGGEADV